MSGPSPGVSLPTVDPIKVEHLKQKKEKEESNKKPMAIREA